MRKKLAGIHSIAPLSQEQITNKINLDREIAIDTDEIDTKEILGGDSDAYSKYLMMFRYDLDTDPATSITRYVPTLEFLGNTNLYVSGADWINIENKTYEILTSGETVQEALEELDSGLAESSKLKHIIDLTGDGSIVSSNDGITGSSTCDDEDYLIVLGNNHYVENAPYALILGGYNSYINGRNDDEKLMYGFVLSGYNNSVNGTSSYSGLIGGIENRILDDSINSICAGGYDNTIEDNANNVLIIGGESNYLSETNEYVIVENGRGCYVKDTYNSLIESSNYIVLNDSNYVAVTGSDIVRADDVYGFNVDGSAVINARKSKYISIDSSLIKDDMLGLYDAYNVSMSSSINSRIWESSDSSIISSMLSNITGYENEITKTISTFESNYVVVASVESLTVGQLITLNGESSDGFEAYLIKSIDESLNEVYLCNFDGTNTDLSKYSRLSYLYVISVYDSSIQIVSNTTSVITLDSAINISNIDYVVISDYSSVQKYSVQTVSDNLHIQLLDYDGNVVSFTENELNDMHLYVYNSDSMGEAIIASSGVNLQKSLYSVIIASGEYGESGCTLANSSYALILASSGSAMYDIQNSVIIASGGSVISNGATYTSIVGGAGHYISGGTESGIFSGGGNHIEDAIACAIIGGGGNYILGSNYVVIAGSGITANVSNTFYANKLNLWNHTITLNEKKPEIGDMMVVEKLEGDYGAILGWGSGATNCHGISGDYAEIKECTLGGTTILQASTSDTSSYIVVQTDSLTSTSSYLAIFANYDLYNHETLSGNYNELISMYDNNAINGNCVSIEDDYDYIIEIKELTVTYNGQNASELAVNSSITLASPLTIYCRTVYDTNAECYYRKLYTIYNGITYKSESMSDNTCLYIHNVAYESGDSLDTTSTFNIRFTYNYENKKLLISAENIYFRSGYIFKPKTTASIDDNYHIVVAWPELYDLPVVDDYVYLYESDPDASSIVSTPNGKVTSIDGNAVTLDCSYGSDIGTVWLYVEGRWPHATMNIDLQIIKNPH